jgi:hypothetical protein
MTTAEQMRMRSRIDACALVRVHGLACIGTSVPIRRKNTVTLGYAELECQRLIQVQSNGIEERE